MTLDKGEDHRLQPMRERIEELESEVIRLKAEKLCERCDNFLTECGCVEELEANEKRLRGALFKASNLARTQCYCRYVDSGFCNACGLLQALSAPGDIDGLLR